MKHLLLILLSAAILCAIPFCMPKIAVNEPPCKPTPPEHKDLPATDVRPFDATIDLQVLVEGTVETMTLRDYLMGVLYAEVPTNFSREALKAQAIASRTFTLKKCAAPKHDNAQICGNSACCQAWLPIEDEAAKSLLSQVVDETDGLVVTYGDELIDATFFSCSDGQTEPAVAVWGSDIPYLQSVASPNEEGAPRFTDTVAVDAGYFTEILTTAYPQINLAGSPISWFGAIEKTPGGGIDTVFIGGVPISGIELRRLFGLRSTDITFTPTETEIIIDTCGFGHRVGMSQYGAQAMAQAGADFEEILTHYYTNVTIKKLLCPLDRAVSAIH